MDKKQHFFLRMSVSVLATAAVAVACSGGDSGSSFAGAPGAEQGECKAGGECDPGLVCLSNLCVDPASGSGGSSGSSASGGRTSRGGGSSSAAGDSSGGESPGGGGEGNGDGGSASQEPVAGAGGLGTECQGSHPLLGEDPPTRYCGDGDCYCPGADQCLAADVAAECCENDPLCGDGDGLAGIECSSMHPIIGPPRTCEPGYCLCSQPDVIDACFPSDVAAYCCPAEVELDCVE